MITVIDNKKGKAYNCTTKTAVSRIVFVCAKTVQRWAILGGKFTFNQFDIYFDSELKKKC
jgi:hypothetical protein